MQGKFLTHRVFPPKPYLTVLDILLVFFAITLNQRQTLLLHINTLACVIAEIIAHAQGFTLLIHCAESLSRTVMFTYSIYE